ncbi:MAG: RHS repeat protein, partial [Oscillospiraceae bacterium]|nr:RHS repeat protein [Oscillospiraceae bacterium]
KYSDYFYANFQPGVHGWQYSAVAMAPKKDYTEITVAAVYHYNVNTIYLDGIQLFKEECGTSYTYDDETGDVISVVDLQKSKTEYKYNTSGDLTEVLENGKSKMKYTYDSHHNVKTATTNLGVKQSFTYDPYGNNTSVTIENGTKKLTSEASYTDSGNLLDYTKDALGKVTKYGYDPDTNVLKWVQYPEDTTATRTNYDYDTMYRMAKAECTTDTGLQQSVNYQYANDLLTDVITPTTHYQFSYGAFGQRTAIGTEEQALATYSYTDDANRYLQQMTYGNSDFVKYTYDDKGRMLTQTYKNGDTVSYAYDNNGALATVTDSATGRTTTYYYDLIDRMMKYVETGTNYFHSVGYEYDEKNTLSEQVEVINGTTHTTAYTYDDDNRIETLTVDGSTITYSYDDYGRLTKQETKKGETTVLTEEYTFTETTIDGVAVTSSQIATYKVTSGGQTTIYTYTYDDNGNILSVSDGTKTTSYVYDSANQLIRENNQSGNFTHTWQYDNAGNILNRKEYAYTTGTLGTPTKTVTYGYTDPNWGDLLT